MFDVRAPRRMRIIDPPQFPDHASMVILMTACSGAPFGVCRDKYVIFP